MMKSIKYLFILMMISACNSDFSKEEDSSITGDTTFVKDTSAVVDTVSAVIQEEPVYTEKKK